MRTFLTNVLLVIFSLPLYANHPDLQKDIARLLKTRPYKNVTLGLSLFEVSPNYRNILTLNHKKKLIPASAQKLFIAAACLDTFGPLYQIQTPLFTIIKAKNGIINGDIYIQGVGDPSISNHDLENTVQTLIKKGIHTITGKLIIDTQFFDQDTPKNPPSARHYYTPTSALNINKNMIELGVFDSAPFVRQKHPSSYVFIKHRYTYLPTKEKAGRPNMTLISTKKGDIYTIKGTVTTADYYNEYLNLCVSNPALYAATQFIDIAQKNGITIKKNIAFGPVPIIAKPLTYISGQPLITMLKWTLEDSNNMVTETLNKLLSTYKKKIPGTQKKGLKTVHSFLRKNHILRTPLYIKDASGLNASNAISAKEFKSLLRWIYNNKQQQQLLIPLLPQMGKHPKYSHINIPKHLIVKAKTGTLMRTGVNSLVGYITNTNTQKTVGFVILANKKRPNTPTYPGTLTTPILELITIHLL